MIYTIYQHHLSDVAHDKLNSVGWDGNFGEFEDAILCHRDVKFRGSDEFKPHYFNLYSKVAKVEAEDLDDVYFIGNTGRPMTKFDKMHSISIGDIIESEGTFFMVDGYGFTQVEVI